MRWFRDHIRRGSWLALVALVVNISLSFGHIHAIDGRGLRSASEIAAAVSPDDGQTPGHHDGDRVDLLCPICMAAGAIGHALSSAPPVLPLALAWSSIDLTIEPVLAVPQSPRAAFHSRGPPIS